ncbi:Phage tail protein [Amycolatopsis lurida]|uniref:Phage tail protein n=1 Tax=Amycolatopsis lurida NRRL 2430 TaxID=1460371 RepID=A0A2P2FWB9_AMYLU|nr:hypothetical protein [Amycolatopsis lurida]KFU81019.1 hypothetical protein BB31_11600 [Amycolatopsis lurida NRRL 2430]SED60196.1 Phage tail protein [Amycolatopsis lurida]
MAGELVTLDGQVEWRDTLLGSDTVFGTTRIAGVWDLPGQRGGNTALPGYHGSYLGQLLSTDREVVWEWIYRGDHPGLPAALDTLRRITAPGENPDNEPLVIQLDGLRVLVNARVKRRAIPTDLMYANVGYVAGAVSWEANDPRLYSVAEKTVSTRLAVPAGGGLDFGGGGLDFGGGGLDFGLGTTGGQAIATNAGHVPTWPVFEITGPAPGPQIIYGGRVLMFDPAWTVLAGQTLRIDTAPGTRTVEIHGVSVRQRLFVAQWTPLEPGEPTRIQFTGAAYDPAAELRAYWRDAYQ